MAQIAIFLSGIAEAFLKVLEEATPRFGCGNPMVLSATPFAPRKHGSGQGERLTPLALPLYRQTLVDTF